MSLKPKSCNNKTYSKSHMHSDKESSFSETTCTDNISKLCDNDTSDINKIIDSDIHSTSSHQHPNIYSSEFGEFVKNPGRVIGSKNVYSNLYNIYVNKDLSKLLIKIPKIKPNTLKFTSVLFPDKKKNQYSNSEQDLTDLYIPDIITDANYSFSGKNTLHFDNNDHENPICPIIHLVSEINDTINLPSMQHSTKLEHKYNGYTEKFSPIYSSTCSHYIDLLPYIKKQVSKWFYAKIQILKALKSDNRIDYNSNSEYESFERRFSIDVLRIQMFPNNIRVGFHLKVDNYDWLDELTNNSGELISQIIETLNLHEQMSFYLLKLPDVPMIGRVYNERVGYFTLNKRIIDAPIDTNIKLITKLNIPLPDADFKIKIIVDPSIPSTYYNVINDMMDRFNEAFNTSSLGAPFILLTPDNIDYPTDYDQHDLRYSRISSTLNINTQYVGLSSSIVDGRSGEILWFQAMIQTEAPIDITRIRLNYTGLSASLSELSTLDPTKFKKKIFSQQQSIKQLKNMGLCQCCLLPDNIVGSGEYQLLFQTILTHELGHCFGLRHNFAGSISGNNPAESQSIMDYPSTISGWSDDENVITNNYKISIGEYDLYAFRYGYSFLNDEITGIPHPYLNGLAAGYTIYELNLQIYDKLTIFNNPKNPLFLTDTVVDLDPRNNVFDNGKQFEWMDREYQLFKKARINLLESVLTQKITPQTFTKLWITYYMKLIRGGVAIAAKYIGGFRIDSNKVTMTNTTRVECIKALAYLMRFLGFYNDAVFENADPILSENIQNYFIRPTIEEIPYLRSITSISFNNRPFLLEIFQTNISFIILNELFEFDNTYISEKLIRLCDIDQYAEINKTTYPITNMQINAPYMDSMEFLNILAFSPGCAIGNVNEFPGMPIGTPYLLLNYHSLFANSFGFSIAIPFSGIYDESNEVPMPYPVPFNNVFVPFDIPEPVPIKSTGLFPEVLLIQSVPNPTGPNLLLLGESYFTPYIVNISSESILKRIQFLSLLLLMINNDNQVGVSNKIASSIYMIVTNIVNTYNPAVVRSVINIASKNGATSTDLSHLYNIFKIATNIQNITLNKIIYLGDTNDPNFLISQTNHFRINNIHNNIHLPVAVRNKIKNKNRTI
jgi:hypothetical protein